MAKGNCEFKGTGRQYLGVFLIHIFLLSMVTLGIYSPWAWVRLFRLRASHTLINAKPMQFTGTGGQFFVLGLVNGLLTLITLGIYWPWAACRISTWKAQHTLVDGKPSGFAGSGGRLFLFSIIHFFILPTLTLGLYYFYAMYRYYAWKQEHFRYGGARTSFGAGFWGLLRIYLVFLVLLIIFPAIGPLLSLPAIDWLSPLVFVIASPWLICMFFQWETKGLMVGDEEDIKHFPPVKTPVLWVIILILVVLFAVAAAGLYIKEQVVDQMGGIDNVTQLLGMKGKGPGGKEIFKVPAKKPPRSKTRTPAPTPSPAAPSAKQPPAPGSATPTVPKKPAPEASLVPEGLFSSEEMFVSTRDMSSEINELDAFIEKDGQNADAYYSRGCLYAKQGDLVEAEKDLTRAIEINSRNSDVFYNRGLVRIRLKDFELAVRDFDQAIELNPDAADAYCNRGNAYLQLGKNNNALKDYNKALQLKADDPVLYYNRGLLYLSMGKKKEAKADFKKAAELKTKPPAEPPNE